MTKLSRSLIEGTESTNPEKVLQFGTGVLLRGLPDYFINKANRQNIFNGDVVIVKSTNRGGTDEFSDQDNLYTIHIKGIEDGEEIEKTELVTSISRVLSASKDWDEIKKLAVSDDLKVIISNTTEVGIELKEDDLLSANPPLSYPMKLTALLWARYQYFKDNSEGKGLVVLPTELISENGKVLKDIVLRLAEINKLDAGFIDWLQKENHFCNTLVDRIVPGKLSAEGQQQAIEELGYVDDLAIMAEPFRLWAIETSSEKVKDILSFSQADDGIIISPDITKFKELKLRLLNGSHTFSCALAILSGFITVKEAMQDTDFLNYMDKLLNKEIVPSIVGPAISEADASEFAKSVIDRFSNPFLNHQWQSISLNYTSKMELRNLPLIESFTQRKQAVPQCMALGFAAYLLLLKQQSNVQDPHAPHIHQLWKENSTEQLVDNVLGIEEFGLTKLKSNNGFVDAVKQYINDLENEDPKVVIKQLNQSHS